VIAGAGGRAFSAGSDLKAIAKAGRPNVYPASGYAGLIERFELDKPLIAAVDGVAVGGGFELALACQTIVAESGVQMGFPEVLFGLFPGMGAYSLLSRRVSPKLAEEMMLNGRMYTSDELHRMGIVDVLAPKGEGVRAVHEVIRQNRRIAAARLALHRVRDLVHPVSLDELTRITEIWVDTALQLGDKSLRIMERLVRAQLRRPEAQVAEETTAGAR
jgi:DSF synthase